MKAYELIADPKNWTHHAFARDANWNPVNSRDNAACSFCALGAIKRAYWDMHYPSYMKLYYHVHKRGYLNIAHWNDDSARTHAEVIVVLKELDI